MNWIIISIFIIAGVANIIISIRFSNLYREGVIPGSGRISLSKLNRALKNAKNEADRKEIMQYRRWHILYLICFYVALAGIIISIFESANHR